MKKFLGKSLVLVAVVALGIFVWDLTALAQFGVDQWAWFAWEAGVWSNVSLLDVVKSFINRVLWLLSLIALGMALFGGFKMVTAAGDDGKYKEGFKVLKQAAIGLVVVGLSWIIVSTIFMLIGWARQWNVAWWIAG